MKKAFYLLAILTALLWSMGILVYSLHGAVHIFLAVAFASAWLGFTHGVDTTKRPA